MKTSPSSFFLSDCGKYLAREVTPGSADFDVLTVDGSQCWLSRRYTPTGFEDRDSRIVYPEFAHQVMRGTFGEGERRGVSIFSLEFADLDTSKKVVPFTGNCIVKKYRATFSRRLKIRARGLGKK